LTPRGDGTVVGTEPAPSVPDGVRAAPEEGAPENLRSFAGAHGPLSREEFLARFRSPMLLTAVSLNPKTWAQTAVVPVVPKGADVSAPPPGKPLYLGRGTENDVVVPTPSVSRRHASFSFADGKWSLTDLGSSNGTRADGRSLDKGTPVHVRSLSTLEFGPDTRFVFFMPEQLHEFVKTVHEAMLRQHLQVVKEPPPLPPPWGNRAPPRPGVATHRVDLAATDEGDVGDTIPYAKALGTIDTMDTLVQKVEVVLKLYDQAVTVYQASEGSSPRASREHLLTLRPLVKVLRVTLSIGDGKPVDLFTEEDSQEGGD
jgi:hypothetical protein